ncbi:MAG: hypothetical protein LH468_09675 [Nocardioides sp.]|nr:hypothetical protein [Nocardioides sp.]
MSSSERFRVGVHFHRHVGGPGHLVIEPGRSVLRERGACRTVVHRGGVVRVERRRWEPPTGNHWIEVSDDTATPHATMGRRRAERVLATMVACGFTVERS